MTNPPPPLSPQADAPTLNAIADRVERAEGADRELDREIYNAVGPERDKRIAQNQFGD